jgi:hypothetical protein
MTEAGSIRYGADLVDDKIRIVRLSSLTGRNVIDLIDDNPADIILDRDVQRSGDLYVSIAEKDALIKSLKVPSGQNLDPDKLALFEFGTSLLDSSDNYFFEVIRQNGSSRCLVVAYNRDSVEKEFDHLENCFMKPTGFRLRALCLAKGYLNYCRQEGGELLCLLDLSGNLVSYCFLRNQNMIMAGAITEIVSGDDNLNNFLIDFKATVQYELTVLFDHGYSLPLSLVVLSGSSASLSLAEQIEAELGVRTLLPSVKPALFRPEVLDDSHKFLVSLGLTTDV